MHDQETPSKPTDDAVSSLPLETARAELLEEIMTAVAPDRSTTTVPARSRRAWLLLPAAAAAVVAAVAGGTFWWQSGPSGPAGSSGVAGQPSVSPSVSPSESPSTQPTAPTSAAGPVTPPVADPSDYRAVLTAPGWTVTSTEADDKSGYGEVDYAQGDASFAITWYAADSYDSYVEDREHIVSPPAPGAPVQVLGRTGQLWAYSADDHTTIREVQAGHWMELRGSGMSKAAYLDLLGQLRSVDVDQLEASLPERFVTSDQRDQAIAKILSGVDDVVGPARSAFPMGQDPTLHSDQQDPYQLGAYVAGQVACAWLDQYVAARADGDQAAADDAISFMATARQWPVLQEMDKSGDYPEVVWDYADEIAAGHLPTGYQQGLGC